ncbi:MAG: hypothetical protein HBSAPP02_08500 [Phycisphaerae bacterium]|nr:MAG: hypothetical protein DCC66_01160 [Planctomycetota bacterium]GJQ25818.1 MAG: hypothetical protein HBSAPP02_08500 [Phycisphaerae bacterium]
MSAMTAATSQPGTFAAPTRRLLLVSYWYPPAIGAAAERIGAFARFLPCHGWAVDVLTAQRTTAPPDLPAVTLRSVHDPQGGAVETFPDFDPRRVKAPDLKRYLRDFIFPDRFRRWMHAAEEAIEQNLRQKRYDAILASFPPASAAWLGLRLHRACGAPFFLDLRDTWFGPGGYEPLYAFAKRRHRALYTDCVRAADGVIAVSQAMADDLLRAFALPPERVTVIPNGFDPALPPMPPPPAPPALNGELIFAHVGTVIARNRPELFLDSLLKLPPDVARGIHVRFVGNLSRDYLCDIGLSQRVEATGLLPREQAWKQIADVHALLLLTGREAGHWTPRAKLFEYLAARRPILCLEEAPGSCDYRLLSSIAPDRSFRAALGDPAGLADAVRQVRAFCNTHAGADLAPPLALGEHSRETHAARLAEYLRARTHTGAAI